MGNSNIWVTLKREPVKEICSTVVHTYVKRLIENMAHEGKYNFFVFFGEQMIYYGVFVTFKFEKWENSQSFTESSPLSLAFPFF